MKGYNNENVGDIKKSASCGMSMLFEGKRGAMANQHGDLSTLKKISGSLIRVSLMVIWFLLVLLGIAISFLIIGMHLGKVSIKCLTRNFSVVTIGGRYMWMRNLWKLKIFKEKSQQRLSFIVRSMKRASGGLSDATTCGKLKGNNWWQHIHFLIKWPMKKLLE